MKDIKFEEVQNLLDSGKQPKEVLDWVGSISYGFRVVGLNYKSNYLDENNKLLSNTWFDYCWGFISGLGTVQLDRKQNYIKPDGTLLSEIWFDYCYIFGDGLAKVILDGETCYINQNGELLHKKQVKR